MNDRREPAPAARLRVPVAGVLDAGDLQRPPGLGRRVRRQHVRLALEPQILLVDRVQEDVGAELERLGAWVERGVFGADMRVESVNDGPVTLILERNA